MAHSFKAVRERFQTITGRFAAFQAQWLNVHVDFPFLQRLALPITVSAVRYPGIKIHDIEVALLFLFFHKWLCGPLANSRFHHRPDATHQPASKLEAAYHRADKAIQQIVDLLAA
jgi:hypothetical protein